MLNMQKEIINFYFNIHSVCLHTFSRSVFFYLPHCVCVCILFFIALVPDLTNRMDICISVKDKPHRYTIRERKKQQLQVAIWIPMYGDDNWQNVYNTNSFRLKSDFGMLFPPTTSIYTLAQTHTQSSHTIIDDEAWQWLKHSHKIDGFIKWFKVFPLNVVRHVFPCFFFSLALSPSCSLTGDFHACFHIYICDFSRSTAFRSSNQAYNTYHFSTQKNLYGTRTKFFCAHNSSICESS